MSSAAVVGEVTAGFGVQAVLRLRPCKTKGRGDGLVLLLVRREWGVRYPISPIYIYPSRDEKGASFPHSLLANIK